MSLGISAQGIKDAYSESDKQLFLQPAQREYNIIANDGMTLKIAQDNLLDWMVNTIDGRRVKLEKQAEILHDYYGDRLLAKEVFQRYLGYKNWTGGVASFLSVGVIGANMWSRVMKNSVFMGKVGTLTSIIALQAAGRYMSNNYLENEISRPWKIHTHRMSKGMGPTNVPSNSHSEIITTPLRFGFVSFDPSEIIFGTKTNYVPTNLDIKHPLQQEHYPYAPDEHDMRKLQNLYSQKFKREELSKPEDDGETIFISREAYNNFGFTGGLKSIYHYPKHFEIYKNFVLNGDQTIYVPEHEHKKVAFEPKSFEQVHKNEKLLDDNEYLSDPLNADIKPDLPLYAQMHYGREHHYLQRIKFKNLKKQLADFLEVTQDSDEAQRRIDDFNEQIKQDDLEYLLKNVKVAAPDVNANFLDDKKAILFFENDQKALRAYYEQVLMTRPHMIKEKSNEFAYDMDFEVDVENYDPWQEYKLIYRDLLLKGRTYYILKSIPDWKFLQIGRPESTPEDSAHAHNPARYNIRDSIFNILTQDRYFHERMTKEGLYKGKSQAIRI